MTVLDRFPPSFVRDSDDVGSNPTSHPTILEVVEARMSRRNMLKGMAAGAALGAFGSVCGRPAEAADNPSTLTFEEIAHGIDDQQHVAKGYTANVLIRWGDTLVKGGPAFDLKDQSAAAQAQQFGYNCDFIGFMPLPLGSNASDHGLLCVNHEYTNAELMFEGLTSDDKLEKLTKEQIEVEMAAHGHSVVEIRKEGGAWSVVADSPYNRRITMMTEIMVSGPAAGSDRLKTGADSTGTKVMGTLNNCAGGTTPWGTVLIAEENFNNYFGGDAAAAPEAASFKRYGLSGESEYAFSKYVDRFDVSKEPNEPNRFGWVVEYDPYDASAVPAKRTALGRLKHEGATTVIAPDGRVVVYTGDDERFDYLYKFVTEGKFDPANRAANLNLLDSGTLYVAQFNADGKVKWLPLVFGEGQLTAANGFNSAADVLIEARRAADLVGATPMDRPEDVEVNPVTGRVYAVMTNNSRRKITQVDSANPRFDNTAGHIVELAPPGGDGAAADHTAVEFTWEHFIIAGNPVWGATLYGKGTSKNGWLAAPDNIAFDPKGRLWISTDQGGSQGKSFGIGDGVYACDVTGDGRALTRFFYRVPADAEMCGPCFTPDGKTLFLAVQHPGEGSSYSEPSTRWPDYADNMPPRPSVIVVTKDDDGEIGA